MMVLDSLTEIEQVQISPDNISTQDYLNAFAQWSKQIDNYSCRENLENHYFYEDALFYLSCIEIPQDIFCIFSSFPISKKAAKKSGYFLSAAFNSSEREFLTLYSFPDKALEGIGYKLPKEKTIINYTNLESLGNKCSGQIVNFGKVLYFALKAESGIQQNHGICHFFGNGSTGGIRVNYQEAEIFGVSNNSLCFNIGQCNEFQDLGKETYYWNAGITKTARTSESTNTVFLSKNLDKAQIELARVVPPYAILMKPYLTSLEQCIKYSGGVDLKPALMKWCEKYIHEEDGFGLRERIYRSII